MSPHAYYTRPANMAFHNLCTTIQVPPGTAALLGLGLKYCIEQPRPHQDFNRSMHRFRRDMRLHCAIQGFNTDITEEDSSNKDYIQRLYIPSNWKPPEAPLKYELTFDTFEAMRPQDHSELHATLEHYAMTQYSVKKGLRLFGEAGKEAAYSEMQQLHEMGVVEPKKANMLMWRLRRIDYLSLVS
jgi:hypothetical protein